MAESCDSEMRGAPSSQMTRHFLVLAATQGVFFDGSGPSFVMVMQTNAGTDEAEIGAVGVYADEKRRAVFGSVPRQTYDAFLHEPDKRSSDVMFRLEINGPQ